MGEVSDLSVGAFAPTDHSTVFAEAVRFLDRSAAPAGFGAERFTLAPDGALASGVTLYPVPALDPARRRRVAIIPR